MVSFYYLLVLIRTLSNSDSTCTSKSRQGRKAFCGPNKAHYTSWDKQNNQYCCFIDCVCVGTSARLFNILNSTSLLHTGSCSALACVSAPDMRLAPTRRFPRDRHCARARRLRFPVIVPIVHVHFHDTIMCFHGFGASRPQSAGFVQ